jgi:hypothetical protein
MPLDFSSMVSSAQRGDVLKPIVHRALYDPTFEGFDVPVEAWSARAYDGKFHPSSQSTWPVRKLYLYLTRSHLISNEHMELSSVLAVTAGKFWHAFLQNLWVADGIMIKQRPEWHHGVHPAEVVVRDPSINVTGHADGELTNGDMVEIKSINDFQILKIENEAVLKEKKYGYWCQTQDYLAVLQREVMRYFTVSLSWPFHMQEFAVKADRKYQAQRRGEYQRAMETASVFPDGELADRNDPESLAVLPHCCAPNSQKAKACEVRLACPVGRYSK